MKIVFEPRVSGLPKGSSIIFFAKVGDNTYWVVHAKKSEINNESKKVIQVNIAMIEEGDLHEFSGTCNKKASFPPLGEGECFLVKSKEDKVEFAWKSGDKGKAFFNGSGEILPENIIFSK